MRLIQTTLLAALLGACGTTFPPLYDELGDGQRPVSTDSKFAQLYFDQGLALCWAFNHDEAVRSFEEAARLDPDCAMAWWGTAFALGTNINLRAIDEGVARRAYRAAQRAARLSENASEVERALIAALVQRYADPPPSERTELDAAYAIAMRGVFERFPDDPDVATLFADSLLNISLDWRAWGTDEERGPHTPEAVATLEGVLARDPDHPGANHLYIHAVEASERPERALPAARRLGRLMPAAGHLVHMPAHIYVRLGLYEDAVVANTRAVAEDDVFFASAPPQGIYHLYRAHNYHFLAWAAMFQGSRARSLDAARDMVARLPEDMSAVPRSLEAYLFVPIHVMMRFGQWEEILTEPAPRTNYRVATALWHHARAVAYANTGRLAEARVEAGRFEAIADALPEGETVGRAKLATILSAARNMMDGEILFKEGRRAEAYAALRRGIEAEDSLPYAEPPGWMQPIRHSLGALLLEAGEAAEAELVYREDLARHADNVWSLHGLGECLRRLGRDTEALAVERRFAAASAQADVEIRSSCFCRTDEAAVAAPVGAGAR